MLDMKSLKLMLSIVFVIVLSVAAALLHAAFTNTDGVPFQAAVTDFESCASAGNAVMESYPRQCRSTDGRLFVEQVAVQVPDQSDQQNQQPGGVEANGPTIGQGCKLGGCGSQLCVDAGSEDVFSTCIYKPEYACYKSSFARCEKQASGQCGWVQTTQMQQCVDEARASGDASTGIQGEFGVY